MVNLLNPSLPVDLQAYNNTGSTIPAFSAVRAFGVFSGDYGIAPELELAMSNLAATMPATGITTGEILDGATGTVRAFGLIYDIDTSAFLDGDALYVDEATPGGFRTGTGAPAFIDQRIGTVLVSDASAGIVFVFPGQEMDGYASYTNRQIFEIHSSAPTSALRMSASGGEIVVNAVPTGNRVVVLPDQDTTLVGRDTTDALTNKRFDQIALDSSGSTFDLIQRSSEALTANRQLKLIVNDADRDLTIAGNATISGTHTGTHSGTSSGTNTGDQSLTLGGHASGTLAAMVIQDGTTSQKGIVQLDADNGENIARAVNGQDTRLVRRGTSFPASPADGWHYYRTDLDELFEYDGTRAKWLSVRVFTFEGAHTNVNGTYLNMPGGPAFSATIGYAAPWDLVLCELFIANATAVSGSFRVRLDGVQAHTRTQAQGSGTETGINLDVAAAQVIAFYTTSNISAGCHMKGVFRRKAA